MERPNPFEYNRPETVIPPAVQILSATYRDIVQNKEYDRAFATQTAHQAAAIFLEHNFAEQLVFSGSPDDSLCTSLTNTPYSHVRSKTKLAAHQWFVLQYAAARIAGLPVTDLNTTQPAHINYEDMNTIYTDEKYHPVLIDSVLQELTALLSHQYSDEASLQREASTTARRFEADILPFIGGDFYGIVQPQEVIDQLPKAEEEYAMCYRPKETGKWFIDLEPADRQEILSMRKKIGRLKNMQKRYITPDGISFILSPEFNAVGKLPLPKGRNLGLFRINNIRRAMSQVLHSS